jgi:hypothetical protein
MPLNPPASPDEKDEVIVRQAKQIEAYQAAERQRTAQDELGRAIDQTGEMLHPGARDQLVNLLSADVRFHPDPMGKTTATGPGTIPLVEHVKGQLAKAEFAHFVVSRPLPAGPEQLGFGPEVRTLSDAVIATMTANKASQASQAAAQDGRVNPSVGFGLRAKR